MNQIFLNKKHTLFFFALALALPFCTASAQTTRIEQLDKSQLGTFFIDGATNLRQTISCADLSGQIEKITVSMQYADNSYNSDYYIEFVGGISPNKRSESVRMTPADFGIQKDITFTFSPPIDVATDLCASGGSVRFDIKGLNSARLAYVFGSVNNLYSGGAASINGAPATPLNLKDLYFIVNGAVNSAPALTSIGNQTTSESQRLTFSVSVTDPDNDTFTLSATGLPSGATFDANTGTFDWTPGYTTAGTYQITFTATENTPEALSDSETVTITVNNTNRAPELSAIGNQTISEGQTLQFQVSATDPDNDTITLSAANLPAGSSFNPSTGVFTWNTSYSDAGNYPDIEFAATDNGSPIELDVELITITVGDVNRMPEITNPGPKEVLEGQQLSFSVSATDPDNDTVTLSVTNLPIGAVFNPTTGTFTWTPTLSQSGSYTVTLTATDNGTPVESASTDIVITVGDDPTPTEQAQSLVTQVITIDIPQNVENSYLANLQKIEPFIQEGKITAALNQLNAFKNKIQQDYQKGILTQDQYQSLLTAVNVLIGDLTS